MKKKQKRNYTYRSMRDERQYGPYWYSGLWNILRPILVGAASLVVVAGLLLTVWNKVYGAYLAPADMNDPTEVAFSVESGQSLTRVANNLESAGLIRNRTVFKYYCDFAGMGQKIQSGNYRLNKAMTMQEIADQLTRGDGNPLVRNITLIPGWTIEEFADKLVQDGVLQSKDEFLQLCRTGEAFQDYYYIADVLATKNVSQRKYVLEGYLAPNTYEVYTDASAEDIIRKLLSQTERAFPADAQEQAAEMGYTMDQIITLASLIEKEAKSSDFAKVSAVFHNRLKQGWRLESDPTATYTFGLSHYILSQEELTDQNLYNTYVVNGLPIGPICNPSTAALKAAMNPDMDYIEQGYMYFCATDPGTGELAFAITLEEHQQNVARYQQMWADYDAQHAARNSEG